MFSCGLSLAVNYFFEINYHIIPSILSGESRWNANTLEEGYSKNSLIQCKHPSAFVSGVGFLTQGDLITKAKSDSLRLAANTDMPSNLVYERQKEEDD